MPMIGQMRKKLWIYYIRQFAGIYFIKVYVY